MAIACTSIPQAQPVEPVVEFLQSSPARLNELRLKQEHARMAFVSAMKSLRQTSKDSPEYEHKRFVFRGAKRAYEAAKSAVDSAQMMVDLMVDSERQRKAEEDRKIHRAQAKENARWAKTVRKAQSRYEFVNDSATVSICQSKGTCRAPCGVLCDNPWTAAAHADGCPQCQSVAQVFAQSFVQYGSLIIPAEEN